MAINKAKLHKELEDAGLPVVSVRDTDPMVDYSRELSQAEEFVAMDVILAHDGKGNKDEERMKLLIAQGITMEKLIFILVDKVFNAQQFEQAILDSLKPTV